MGVCLCMCVCERALIFIIGGWGRLANLEIVFVSFVRASEAAYACETMLLPRLGCRSSENPWRRRRVPSAGLAVNRCNLVLIMQIYASVPWLRYVPLAALLIQATLR